jgi:hypothetical protein
MMEASFENRTDRAVTILLVLILHALLILALLRFMVSPQNSPFRMVPEARLFEMMIDTARSPITRKEASKPAPARAAARPVTRAPVPNEPLAPAAPAPAPDIRGFGQALAGCAPENFIALDEAQRSHCRKLGAFSSYDPGATNYADRRDQVPGAKQWEQELARKQAPLLLPCGNAKALDPAYTGACIIANIANGFTFKTQYENQRGYKSGKSQ